MLQTSSGEEPPPPNNILRCKLGNPQFKFHFCYEFSGLHYACYIVHVEKYKKKFHYSYLTKFEIFFFIIIVYYVPSRLFQVMVTLCSLQRHK